MLDFMFFDNEYDQGYDPQHDEERQVAFTISEFKELVEKYGLAYVNQELGDDLAVISTSNLEIVSY